MLIAALTILLSCLRKEEKKTFISGIIDNYNLIDDWSVKVIFSNFGISNSQYSLIDNKGAFQIEFDLCNPIDFRLMYNEKTVRLYAEPGDIINIRYNALDFPDNIEFNGDNWEFNSSLVQFNKESQEYFKSYLVRIDSVKKISPNALVDFVVNTKSKNKLFIEEFSKEYNCPRSFIQWVQYDMNYAITHDLIFFRGPKNDDYYSFFNYFKIDDKAATISFRYWEYLQGFIVYLFNYKYSIPADSINLNKIFEIISENSTDSTRDNLLTHIYVAAINQALVNNEDIIKSTPTYIENISDKTAKRFVLQKYNYFMQSLKESRNLQKIFKIQTIDIELDTIFNKYVGNVVFIKVWANWCGPCIETIPDYIKIQTDFKDKPIKFITFAIRSDSIMTNKIIYSYNLPGEHYFLSKNQELKLEKLLGIQTIPHYAILDKNGILVETNAQSPVDERIYDIIDNLIENNILHKKILYEKINKRRYYRAPAFASAELHDSLRGSKGNESHCSCRRG